MPLSLTIQKIEGKPGQVYYPLKLNRIPQPSPGPGEVLIRLKAVALNHRDLFIRQHLYPNISFTTPLFSDGYGTVIQLGPIVTTNQTPYPNLLHQSVLPMPCVDTSPLNPTATVTVLGSTTLHPAGMGQDYLILNQTQIEPCPAHLTPSEAAALPLSGLTAWRAVVTKTKPTTTTTTTTTTGSESVVGKNMLITGIGGGVALLSLQFAVALGWNVYVTSSSVHKITVAVSMGAKSGVIYTTSGWETRLSDILPASRPFLDVVVDGAGGDIVGKTFRLLKNGGIVVQYGMTLGAKMDWHMGAVLKNIELRGSTMGSREEFKDMVRFVKEKKIKPVVSRVVKGLDNLEGIDGLFDHMEMGKQFGKLVVEFGDEVDAKL